MAVFFWKRANTAGAISSIVAGTVITVVWNVLEIQWLDAVYPALAVSLLALVGREPARRRRRQGEMETFLVWRIQ